MDRLTKGNGECAWALHNGLWLEPYELAIERDNVHTIGNLMRRLAKYEITGRTPEEIQNAIFLPCQVGDTVWRIVGRGTNGHRSVQQRKVLAVTIYHTGDIIIHTDGAENRFGKTVFLTREEAEAALGGANDA